MRESVKKKKKNKLKNRITNKKQLNDKNYVECKGREGEGEIHRV